MSAIHEPSLGQPVPIANLDLIGVGVLQIGVDAENTFRIQAANRRAADLIGLENPHLPQAIEQVLPGETIGELVSGLRDCGHTGREIELEVLHRKEGAKKWLRYVLNQSHEKKGQSQNIIATITDVTARKQAEVSTLESELKFLSLAEGSFLGIMVTRKDRTLFANQAYANLMGYSSSDELLLLATSSEMIHKEDRSDVVEYINDFASEKSAPDRFEHRLIRKNGEPIWVEVFPSLVKWEGRTAIQCAFHDVTESKRLETEFEEQHKLLETIFDIIPVILYTKDRDRRMTYMNRDFAEQYDLDPREVIGKRSEDFSYRTPEEVTLLRETDNRVMETGERQDLSDYALTLPNGEVRYREGSKMPLRNAKGEVVGLVGMSIDVTDRVNSERILRESEARFRAIVESLPYSVAIVDQETARYAFVNEAFRTIFGIGDPIEEHHAVEFYVDPKDRDSVMEEIRKFGRYGPREVAYRSADGKPFWALGSGKGIIYDGRPCYLNSFADITDKREAESKLRKNEALLRAVFDALPLFMSVKDTQGRFIMMNRAEAEFLNFPLDRLGTFSNEDIYWRDESGRRKIIAEDERVLNNLERIAEFDQPVKLLDGREIVSNRTKAPILDEEGKILGLVAVHHDVTELWNAREEARGKQALLEAVFDALPLFMAVKDTQGRYIMMNRAAAEFLDFPLDRLGAFRNEDIYWLDESGRRSVMAEDERVLKHGERIETFANPLRLKDEREIICDLIKAPITDEDGNILGLVTVDHDVTELWRARKEAQEKQALLETVFDALPLWVIVKDTEQRFVLANRAMAEEVDFPMERLGEFHNRDIYWLIESDHQAIVSVDEEILRTGIRMENPDAVFHRKDGNIVHRHSIRVPIVAESGEITGLVSVALDITEQKEVELQLRKSEALLHSVVDNTPVVLWALDQEGRITLSEGKGLLAQGLKPGEVVGLLVFDLYRDYPDFLANVRRAMNGESVVAVNKTQGVVYERMMEPMRNEDGSVTGLIGVSLDITERHRAEMALRGSEERYRALVEGSVQGIIVYDLNDNRALFANETLIRMTDFTSLEELIKGEFLFETVLAPYAQPLKEKLELIAEGSLKQFQTELLVTRKTKPNFWGEVIGRRIDWDGIQAVQFTVMDISDRKRAEEAMKDQQALLTKQNEYFQQDISRRRERHQEGIIAESHAMRHVLREAELVAKANIPILIEGETGTGKEIVAEYIHRQSDRSKHLLSIVNCGALTENLMDAELFGHERGAFTGAGDARAGMIEIADRGTLFLDEIGDIPASGQVRLLRFLEQGVIRRVGSNREKKVDVRILAATHKTLKEQVAEGTFREDLYHRLLVIRIVVPPLRDRLEDIIPFSQRFLEQACMDAHIDPKSFGEDARLALTRYEWPGNVRELSHTVQRAVFSAQLEGSNTIRPEHLDLHLPASADEITLPIKEVKRRAERQHAHTVLRHFNGNRRKASESMGISERQLYRILD